MKIINDENFENELKIISKEYGFDLNDNVCKNLRIYKELLVEWNEKINLTAITDNYGIIIKHFIDCLKSAKYLDVNSKVIDIGTGAGFPGIVIAIYYEDKLNITLLDSLNKRINFLEEVKNKLNFNNINIVSGRAEEFGNKLEFREKYDFVLSRAVAPFNILLEMTVPYLKISGKGLYMKGQNFEEEKCKSLNALKILNSKILEEENYDLIFDNEILNRKIILVQKLKSIYNKYPRQFGKIKNKPL